MPDTHPIAKRVVSGVLMAALFALAAYAFDLGTQFASEMYYRYASTDAFLVVSSITVSDICLGETSQSWVGKRHVFVREGIPAEVVRELYKIVTPNTITVRAKVFEESAVIFIEPTSDDLSYRLATVPLLEQGEYQWTLYYKSISLPYDIKRVPPPINTNTFTVYPCN